MNQEKQKEKTALSFNDLISELKETKVELNRLNSDDKGFNSSSEKTSLAQKIDSLETKINLLSEQINNFKTQNENDYGEKDTEYVTIFFEKFKLAEEKDKKVLLSQLKYYFVKNTLKVSRNSII